MHTGYYIDSFLMPLAPWLAAEAVTDIYINRPGEIWVESLGGTIARHTDANLTEKLLARLARQIAAHSSQGISRAQPLLAATLPDGSRVQVAGPPATRDGFSFAVRRHIASNISLDELASGSAFANLKDGGAQLDADRQFRSVNTQDAPSVLRQAVLGRRNILVSGGTSTGKTTFLNALLKEIPAEERLILIEDAAELQLEHENSVGLIAARGDMSEAAVDAEDLLIAALRMRPDRIILGELRGVEALTFLRAINTGHPGSMTTIHADSPQRAIEQLALLVLQAGSRLTRDDVRHYVRESIDVFVQLERMNGRRAATQILASTDFE